MPPSAQSTGQRREFRNLLVTGGCGFIGSAFIRYLRQKAGFEGRIINLDALTYAGNPENLAGVFEPNDHGYVFQQGDICDAPLVNRLLSDYEVDGVAHFAAESHVDRSILGPENFVETNIRGTFVLLEAVRSRQAAGQTIPYLHVSTDEVYGSLGPEGYFYEDTAYAPNSPYAASKAASDHLARAYRETYEVPVFISNCSNNYGPYQFPEKLIPLMIRNARAGNPLPVYGDGSNVRDWLFVEDHAEALWLILTAARPGEVYNIGGRNEWTNLKLVRRLCDLLAEETGNPAQRYHDLIEFVSDRPGHDLRYAINCDKIARDLGWTPRHNFEEGLRETIRWYLNNPEWLAHIESGEYRHWLKKQYGS